MRILESDGAEIKTSQPSSNLAEPGMPDLSTIELDESFVPIKSKATKPKAVPKASNSNRPSPKADQLEEVARKLIAIGQQLLETVTAGATTCGTIGTNMAGPQKDPMKTKKKKKLNKKRLRKLPNGYLKFN